MRSAAKQSHASACTTADHRAVPRPYGSSIVFKNALSLPHPVDLVVACGGTCWSVLVLARAHGT